MGKAILITGGARSGKSRFAEKIMRELEGPVLYLATAKVTDEEMEVRVQKHKAQRPAHWTTIEGYKNLGNLIAEQGNTYDGILLDCITIMVTNLLFEIPEMNESSITMDSAEKAESTIMDEIDALIDGIQASQATVVMVTNEIGSGIVPEYPLARIFRDIAGRVNQRLASQAQEVYLAVSGIPIRIK